jgi:hypothetical protein
MSKKLARDELLCPSALAEMPGAKIFGVVTGVETPRVSYLDQPIDAESVDLGLAPGVSPGKLFRATVPCLQNGCPHFDGCNCQLGARVLQLLPSVTEGLPPCSIRGNCRWFRERGKAICLRCPGVVSEPEGTRLDREVAAFPVASTDAL